MKRLLIPALLGLGLLSMSAKAPKDPVLLEVDGRPVTLSEFEYFYHKNDGNEIEKETPEQYLRRFIDYKLKVAQAREERRDTTAEYRKDYQQYRHDLALPYLNDEKTREQLRENSYKHTLVHRKLDHLMLPANDKALADSLRQVLVNGGDFEAIVMQYSIDPSKAQNRGHYDWIGAGQFPYEFEEIAFDTPLNQISNLAQSSYGYHIVRPTAERPNLGEVRAGHILVKLDEGADSAAAKARIDSIYNVLQQTGQFEVLARRHSDCPSSAKDGDLGFFSRGQMVPEFEEVAFSLENNTFSKPFLSRFGWHIVKKYDSRNMSRAEAMQMIDDQMKRDIRSIRPKLVRADQLKEQYNVKLVEQGREKLLTMADELGFDSMRHVLDKDITPLITIADSTVTIGDFLNSSTFRIYPNQPVSQQIASRLDNRLNTIVLQYEEDHLDSKHPEYAALVNEYAEGLMLVASLEDNVWNRPTKDPEGLKAYFEANKDKYAFSAPRWKGYIIYATSDSLKNDIASYLAENKPSPEVLGDSIKSRYPREVRIERVVLPQGENQVVDYIAFNGPEPVFSNRFRYFTTYMPHLINGPEEVADVRNRVTNDWTRELEEQFVEGLRKKFPVKVNKKVLKKVK